MPEPEPAPLSSASLHIDQLQALLAADNDLKTYEFVAMFGRNTVAECLQSTKSDNSIICNFKDISLIEYNERSLQMDGDYFTIHISTKIVNEYEMPETILIDYPKLCDLLNVLEVIFDYNTAGWDGTNYTISINYKVKAF